MWNPVFSLQDALMRHAHAKQGINRVPFMPGVPGLASWDGFNPLAAGSAAAHRPFHVQQFLKQAAVAQQQLQRHVSFMNDFYLEKIFKISISHFQDINIKSTDF
jgi:hypothetical protein